MTAEKKFKRLVRDRVGTGILGVEVQNGLTYNHFLRISCAQPVGDGAVPTTMVV